VTGQKSPLKLKEIWAIRIRLQLSARVRDLAMFDLAINSKLRACDLTKLKVRDMCHVEHAAQVSRYRSPLIGRLSAILCYF
jgi:hypothetical protein